MIEAGTIVKARVTRIEPYGIWLQHDEQKVLVLMPEVSWLPGNVIAHIVLGLEMSVYVLRYNYRDKVIVGSFKRLRPDQNPYRLLARLAPGAILQGKIVFATSEDVTVALPNEIQGTIPRIHLPDFWKIGDPINVVISALELDEGILHLEPATEKAPSFNNEVFTEIS